MLDIVIVAIIIYQVYYWVSKTAALPVLQGFMVVIAMTFLSRFFELKTLNFVLEQILALLLFSVIVLFPAEIKRAFAKISYKGFLSSYINLGSRNIETIVATVEHLKKRKIGALIILSRNDRLTSIASSGVEMNARINKQLLLSIFQKESPLHDGGVIIAKNQLISAACFIPNISFNFSSSGKKLGTRHRSALALCEITDALVIVVSEETGQTAIADGGNLVENVSKKRLSTILEKM